MKREELENDLERLARAAIGIGHYGTIINRVLLAFDDLAAKAERLEAALLWIVTEQEHPAAAVPNSYAMAQVARAAIAAAEGRQQ